MILNRRYHEIMDRIQITDDMKARILKNVSAADLSRPKASRVVRLRVYRRHFAAAACFAVLLAGALILPGLRQASNPPDPSGGTTMAIPDIVEAASAEELSQKVGFTVRDLSNLPFTPEETRYTSYWGNLAEIQYAGSGQSAVFRKSAGTEDNSGDYESYRETADLSVQGNSVTLKGDGETYALALWTDGTYAYSLRLSPGVPESAWAALISGASG